MELLPRLFQGLRMTNHQALRAFDVPIRDRAYDLDRPLRREGDSHDRASLGDVHVRRRMIEGIDSHLESRLANQGRHSTLRISKAFGLIKPSEPDSRPDVSQVKEPRTLAHYQPSGEILHGLPSTSRRRPAIKLSPVRRPDSSAPGPPIGGSSRCSFACGRPQRFHNWFPG